MATFLLVLFISSCKKNETSIEELKPDIYKNIKFIKDWIPLNEISKNSPEKKASTEEVLKINNPLKDIITSWVAQGNKWNNNRQLRIAFTNSPSRVDFNVAKNQIINGISAWFQSSSPALNLSIIEVQVFMPSDIKISWHKGNHGDGANNAFDGPGGVLAHATYPTNGTIHFDDDENWSASLNGPEPNTIDIAAVAAHEFGHAIGLDHSDCSNAIMAPYYSGLQMRTMSVDDIVGSRTIYNGNLNYFDPNAGGQYGMIGTETSKVGDEFEFWLFYSYNLDFSNIFNPTLYYDPNRLPPFRYGYINWIIPQGLDLISGQGTSKIKVRVNGQYIGNYQMQANIGDCNASIALKSSTYTLQN